MVIVENKEMEMGLALCPECGRRCYSEREAGFYLENEENKGRKARRVA